MQKVTLSSAKQMKNISQVLKCLEKHWKWYTKTES